MKKEGLKRNKKAKRGRNVYLRRSTDDNRLTSASTRFIRASVSPFTALYFTRRNYAKKNPCV